MYQKDMWSGYRYLYRIPFFILKFTPRYSWNTVKDVVKHICGTVILFTWGLMVGTIGLFSGEICGTETTGVLKAMIEKNYLYT
jgi:hypothetical protein